MTILHSTDFFKAGISTVAIEPRLPQSAFPEHHHDFHEIVIVEQGSGIHVFNGQPYTIGGGSVCFIRDHDRHLYEHTDNLCLTNVLYRAPDAFRFLAGVSQLLPRGTGRKLPLALAGESNRPATGAAYRGADRGRGERYGYSCRRQP